MVKTTFSHGKPAIFSWFHRFTRPILIPAAPWRQVLRGAANTAGGSMEDFLRQATVLAGKTPMK